MTRSIFEVYVVFIELIGSILSGCGCFADVSFQLAIFGFWPSSCSLLPFLEGNICDTPQHL